MRWRRATPADGPLHTVSLRRRVTVTMLALLAAVLAAVIVTVNLVLSGTLHDDLKARLADRAGYAVVLEQQGVGGQTLADKLTGGGVFSVFTSGQGRFIGRDQGPPGPGRPPGAPPPRTTAPATIVYSQSGNNLVATVTLPAGKLTVQASMMDIDRTMSELIRIEWLAGGGILLGAALLSIRLVGTALKPLRRMSEVARTIAAGARGRRLRPSAPRTDLGQAAAAFDTMLDALEAAEQHAQQAEASMRQFLADASHDLRTPLAGMLAGSEQLLRNGSRSRAELEGQLVAVIRQGRRAARLVDDLVLMARLSGTAERELALVPPPPVSLTEVVRAETEGAALRHPLVRVGSRLPAAVSVRADRDALHRAVTNVLENAATAAGPGGEVLVDVGLRDGWAVLTVSDNGPGVASADRERIFDRFVRLDDARSGGGSGLGLPISRALIRAAGGELTCEDPVAGRGGSFRLRLPSVPSVAVRVDDRGGQPGPGLRGPGPERRVRQADAGQRQLGVHPQEAAVLAEVPEGAGRVLDAGPVR